MSLRKTDRLQTHTTMTLCMVRKDRRTGATAPDLGETLLATILLFVSRASITYSYITKQSKEQQRPNTKNNINRYKKYDNVSLEKQSLNWVVFAHYL